ncbi:MAG TPA: nucleoside permease [Cyclobacteriaceae bacterium]|jgi:nucleoside transporter|nr:nucleoside permease [Cytophagales bacterium]HMR56922.1 nucleoside permease [Cyclobacteriaceae bacterium]HNT49131.1 nucleoside permease [Cyclobacteriaceae bacterium]HRE68259.1 nucleoside permease [Cyclobacteriaceae bacterium]HRF34333.1 nucleoside permease [Cyclobacteriaceae bacterium]
MKSAVFTKLSVMMLLEYFIWGAWYVTMGTYMSEFLGATGTQIGAAYSALAIATMISPFFVGMVADRFFAAQKIMGVLHLIGAVLLYLATVVNDNTTFYWIILVYSLLYMPTIALSNSIAFGQMTDPGKQFPWIRVFGTLGWIIAGVLISSLGLDKSALTFQMAAIASLALGLSSFVLPNTPPKGKTSESALGTEAFVLFKDKPYLIFFIAAILVCIPLSFYYGFANVFLNETGMNNVAFKMTFGQISEAVFILAIPFLFNQIGVKKMLLLGMTAWILRYVFFAYGNIDSSIWMLYAGIILHGICYDFFFVTGYMYTEKKAGDKIKNAAQGLFTFATYGVGMVIGTRFSGFTADHYSVDGAYQWQSIWMVPVYIAVAVLIYFILFFKEKKEIQAA